MSWVECRCDKLKPAGGAVVSAAATAAVSWIKSYGQTLASFIHQRHMERPVQKEKNESKKEKKREKMGVVPLSPPTILFINVFNIFFFFFVG